jgi:prevent-host-death family protein
MKTVTMREAKAHLSRLIKALREGRETEIIISIGNAPVARLLPYEHLPRRVLGLGSDMIQISNDFDAVD